MEEIQHQNGIQPIEGKLMDSIEPVDEEIQLEKSIGTLVEGKTWTTQSTLEMDGMAVDWIPTEGMEFNTIEEAWEFWKKYAMKMGFGVRKHYANKDKKTGVITSTRLLCSKEGIRAKDKRDDLIKNPRAETRTSCLARMGLILIRETGKYRVHDLVEQHNHELHLPECIHMLPSQRKITNAQAIEAELAVDAGLTQKGSHEFFSRQVGGREHLGFMRLDQKNYLRTRRQRELAYGEVGSLLGYFQKQSFEDPSFFYALQLDNSEKITNIFWADTRMLIDYSLFGEVLTFDTTFSTNKEYRPLGVFVGFNHHRELVIFGAALLYDETAESFAWLFEKFLWAHKLKKPSTIFTDQAKAMAKALKKVMPTTRHGLCTWHMMQNGITHLGNMMKDGSFFLRDLKKLMYEYEDEPIFEKEWDILLSFYNVSDNSWLAKIYKIKEKWAKCYMKTSITLGMRSTQLSESFNGDLKDYLKSNLDITSFFKHFERVVEAKRYKEKEAEYNAREKLPRLKVKSLPLLQQAGKVYTPTVFEIFQEEWEKSLITIVKECNENDTLRKYLVGSYNDNREHMVTSNSSNQTVSCSCKMFETFGILCSHSLCILNLLNIKLIPDAYIVKRWTREAREGTLKTSESRVAEVDANLEVVDRYRDLCPEIVQLATIASDSQEGYILMKNAINVLKNQLSNIGKKHNGNIGHDDEPHDSLTVLGTNVEQRKSFDNLLSKVKGLKKKDKCKGGKRQRSWVEKQGKKKKYTKLKKSQKNGNVNIEESTQKGSVSLSSQFSNYDQFTLGSSQQIIGGLNGFGGVCTSTYHPH